MKLSVLRFERARVGGARRPGVPSGGGGTGVCRGIGCRRCPAGVVTIIEQGVGETARRARQIALQDEARRRSIIRGNRRGRAAGWSPSYSHVSGQMADDDPGGILVPREVDAQAAPGIARPGIVL